MGSCLQAPIICNEALLLTMYILQLLSREFFMLCALQTLLDPQAILLNFDHTVVRSDAHRRSG